MKRPDREFDHPYVYSAGVNGVSLGTLVVTVFFWPVKFAELVDSVYSSFAET
jgi:hypothetical protein